MTIKQLREVFSWRVGQYLHSDLTRWRIPSIVLRAIGGLLLSGLVLALTVPLLAQNGRQVNQPFAWLVMLGCLALCIAPEVRRILGRRRVKPSP